MGGGAGVARNVCHGLGTGALAHVSTDQNISLSRAISYGR